MEAIRLHAMLSTFACGFAIDKWSRTGLIPRLTDGKFVDRTLSLLIERRISGRDSLMKMLSQEELNELRKDIAVLGIPDDCQDDLIRLIDSIVISFVEQAHGLNPVQISLSSRANYAFNGDSSHANLRTSTENAAVPIDGESARRDEGPIRQVAP